MVIMDKVTLEMWMLSPPFNPKVHIIIYCMDSDYFNSTRSTVPRKTSVVSMDMQV